jgi:hypothetical protein
MTCSSPKHRCAVSLLAAFVLCGNAASQSLFNESDPAAPVRMINGDRAVLEAREERRDLGCNISPVKPALGFDLRFHSGYEVSIPLKELAGQGNTLLMVFRVTPEGRSQDVRYFFQRVAVPEISPDAGGSAYLGGTFDVGEGRYSVDWLVRDAYERYCSSSWDIEAKPPEEELRAGMRIAPGEVQASEPTQFNPEPPVPRESTEDSLNVRILINFAPQRASSAVLQPIDTAALVSILRTIARDPRIGTFSVVAFNLQEQRIIYRQENADHIDFPALGKALETLNLGTVDLKRLEQKHGETEFLATLIQNELGGQDQPDALIFAGPKAMLDQNVPTESLREIGKVDYPVFYMNYNLRPQEVPWRDAIGRAVRFFRGQEFTISRPRDVWSAVTEIVARVVRTREVRRASGGPIEQR